MELIFFIAVGLYLSVYDYKHRIIPDIVVLPSILFLLLLRYINDTLSIEYFYATLFIVSVFILPIIFNMRFGGGDIRFGIFAAILLGFPNIALFLLFSAILHLLLLLILKKKEYPFAPSMYIAAILVYMMSELLWKIIQT